MLKSIFSKRELSEYIDYYSCVSDLLSNAEVNKLKMFRHHIFTTRFQHSLNVSYYNFRLCKLLNLDFKAAARAGLLHDFFFYNRKEHQNKLSSHSAEHPAVALENAVSMFTINDIEADMIVNHMWPMTTTLPRYRETFVITVVDKFCAVGEVGQCIGTIIGKRLHTICCKLNALAVNSGIGYLW